MRTLVNAVAIEGNKWGRYIPTLGINLILGADSQYHYDKVDFYYTIKSDGKKHFLCDFEIEGVKPLYLESFHHFFSVSGKPIVFASGDTMEDNHTTITTVRIR